MQRSVTYTILFAAAVCFVCAVFVSTAAVSLRDRQVQNAHLDKQQNVLVAAGLAKDGERLTRAEIERRSVPIQSVVIDLATGKELPDVDPQTFDPEKILADPETSRPAPPNRAGIQSLPTQVLVYRMEENGKLKMIILPIEGKGLWSTLYGFLALDADRETIRGITFYEHKETPGLGGEVDNPKWKALWAGRRAFGGDMEPKIHVIRGKAGPPEQDPYSVDGLSGATLTSRGVTNLVQFWLGDDGFGPYLKNLEKSSAESAGQNSSSPIAALATLGEATGRSEPASGGQRANEERASTDRCSGPDGVVGRGVSNGERRSSSQSGATGGSAGPSGPAQIESWGWGPTTLSRQCPKRRKRLFSIPCSTRIRSRFWCSASAPRSRSRRRWTPRWS